jgi:hypothetical protein
MASKICSKCNLEKDTNSFRISKVNFDGRFNWCKDCEKKYKREHYQLNKQKIDKKNKKWKEKNRKKYDEYHNQYYQNNKEKLSKNYKDYYEKNKKQIQIQKQKYDNNKRKNNLLHKFTQNIRVLIRLMLKKKGFSKSSHTYEILGISYKECLSYLFEKAKLRYPDFQPKDFLENNNYHIDHITPLVTAKTENDVIRLCHYTNLQLLTKEDNLEKLDRLDWEK